MLYKLLIVDDEPMVIHGLCKQIDWDSCGLELAGTADSGEKALSILDRENVDILLTDVRMSKMDGLSLISAAQRKNPFLRSVVISSYSEFDYVKRALLLNVENYLLKPINPSELDRTLKKTIDNLNRDRLNAQKEIPNLSDFRDNILDRWVNAEIQDYEFYERAEVLRLNLSAPQYQICVFQIDGAQAANRGRLRNFLEKYRNAFARFSGGEYFIDRRNDIVILFSGEDLEVRWEDFGAVLNGLLKDFSKEDVRIFASIGALTDSLDNIPHDYTVAVDFLNYRFVDPDADHITVDSYLRISHTPGYEALQILFEKALSEMDYEKSRELAGRLLELFRGSPLDTVKKALIPFLLTLLKQMDGAGKVLKTLPRAVTAKFSTVKTIRTFDTLAGWFYETVRQSLNVMGNRKKLLNSLVQQMLEVVRKEYYADISLKTISTDLKVSPAYLGQLFKKETGKYFNDYLTEVRLMESRRLLLRTDLKIKDIVLRVGMLNQSYYNRVFKKHYGVSPRTFRQQRATEPTAQNPAECL